jgi:diguanylate cyclase (GGDEF)-like protein/PAS domain S-box-containing protein
VTEAPDIELRLTRRLERERRARLESEQIAESTLRDLYSTVVELQSSQTELNAAASLVAMLQKVAIAANEAETFEDAVETALAAVCAHTGWPIGHLYVTDEPGHLRSTAIWHTDDPDRSRNFRQVTESTDLHGGVGLPGRVLTSGAPAWIEDVSADQNFPRAHAALEIEVRAGFAFPVVVGTEVVAVLEFFAHEAIETDQNLLSVLANVGSQLGRVVERVRAAEQLQMSEGRTREILQTANDAFVAIDVSGRITEWNRQAENSFGWTRAEVIGELLSDLIIPEMHRDAHNRGIERFLASDQGPVLGRRVELEALHRDGHQFPVELTPWVVRRDGIVRFNAFIHDITERKAFEHELEHQSLHDSLTGLPNRALLLDRIEGALARADRSGNRVALLFIDLDRFKAVNDSLGHEAGDSVLLGVAERVPHALRGGDTLARLSGDEFVVLCEDVRDSAAVTAVADRILDQLARPFMVGGTEAHVSGSIGIALTAGEPISAEALLADADLAMYRAKERGKGVSELFDEALRVRVTERLATERALRTAIDDDELIAYYQPLVDISKATVAGVEALVRWRHPQRGLLLPGEFVPLAEDSALVSRIGAWMLHESCRQLGLWRATLPQPPNWVAVNLSVRELEQPGLIGMIAGALEQHDLPPNCLMIEITESAVMHDTQAVIRRLWELKEMGVRLAIDDFGTGFSSLDRLRRMPVESLKIDRSFIGDMDVTTGGTALVAAIIAMSHSLGLSVAAEGVETMEQLHELRRLGCDELQGYLLATPQPADELEALLRSGSIQSSIPPLDQNARAAVEVQEEMLRFIQRALGHGHEVERTTRSLLAELQRLVDTRIPA